MVTGKDDFEVLGKILGPPPPEIFGSPSDLLVGFQGLNSEEPEESGK